MKMRVIIGMRWKFAPLAGAFILLSSMGTAQADTQWYKGNTHAHTVLCGHADSSPEAVAKWYHDHGYQFLVLSEHNIFIDPATVELPEDSREDFILSGVDRAEEILQVAVDEKATLEAVQSPYVIGDRRPEASGGILIEFVGPGGNVLKHVHAVRGSYAVQADDGYVRCRVTYTRRSEGGFEQFFAWTQPVFTDGRLERLP